MGEGMRVMFTNPLHIKIVITMQRQKSVKHLFHINDMKSDVYRHHFSCCFYERIVIAG